MNKKTTSRCTGPLDKANAASFSCESKTKESRKLDYNILIIIPNQIKYNDQDLTAKVYLTDPTNPPSQDTPYLRF